MIHVATIHQDSPRWIEIQRRHLDRFVSEPFRLYATLTRIDQRYVDHFDHASITEGEPAGRLNHLGHVILDGARPDDLILFLAGDGFPIADLLGPLRSLLDRNQLVAVCRTEDGGSPQPHPSFAAVTASTWDRLAGDWSSGHILPGDFTDTGANLLRRLEATQTSWAPLLRTRSVDIHPVLFGIYGELIYAHGSILNPVMVTRSEPALASVSGDNWLRDYRERNLALSARLLDRIESDPGFFGSLG